MVAAELTPAPDGLALESIADEFADMVGFWDHIRATQPGLPHLEEAAALAGAFADVAAGDTVVHTDLRDDNFLIGADGTRVDVRLELAGRWAPTGSTPCSCWSGRAATGSTSTR